MTIQWLRLHAFHCIGHGGSIPGQGKIREAKFHSAKNEKNNNTEYCHFTCISLLLSSGLITAEKTEELAQQIFT